MLIENGHPWSSIQKYTLGQIGIFIKAVLLREEQKRIERFSFEWFASNLNLKGFKQHINEMEEIHNKRLRPLPSTEEERVKQEQEDIEKEWKRFATAMGGLR